MKLTAVHYELFESDAKWMAENADHTWHTIDREVRLTFADAPTVYVSWMQNPVEYAIEYQDHSFFVIGPDVVRDLTKSAIWSPLIGSDVNLRFLDNDHQVLCVKSATHAVYCCSYKNGWGWEVDVVTITSQAPDIPLQSGGGFAAAAERQNR